MSLLNTTLEATRHEAVRHASRGATYTQATRCHAALVEFSDIGALLDALDLRSQLAAGDRRQVVAALVAEAQRAPHPLWQSLLLVAVTPMLRRLRTRLGNPGSEELDQRVLFAFLSAVRAIASGPHTALALRWRTEKELFRPLRKERQAPETFSFDEEECAVDLHGVEAADKAAVAEVARFVEATCERELVDVFLATTAATSG